MFFSRYGWIEGLNKKKKLKIVLVKHLIPYLKKVNVNQECYEQIKDLSLLVNILRIFLIKMESNYITLKMNKNQVLLRDGIKL